MMRGHFFWPVTLSAHTRDRNCPRQAGGHDNVGCDRSVIGRERGRNGYLGRGVRPRNVRIKVDRLTTTSAAMRGLLLLVAVSLERPAWGEAPACSLRGAPGSA
jgi:hypothetical protein